MPKYPLVESMSRYAGVNTYADIPSRQERAFMSARAINRSALRNLNETRPPFKEINLSFDSTEQEYTFRNGAISGMKFYQGEGKLTSSYLIIAVGDLILAGLIRPNSISFYTIYKGIDPQWTHSWFTQALNILVWQNDNDLPLYWTGDPQVQMKLAKDSLYIENERPIMVGNVSCYAHGRIFLATNNNLVYASDYIYAAGLAYEQRERVLSFNESSYPSSGDGFGAPSEMGPITGLFVVPQSDTLNGHGDVLVTCRNGIFSISPNNKVRNEWTNDPSMQRNVLVGKGCVSNESIIPFANQIIYRDSNGDISSMLMDIANYQNRAPFEEISRPVKEYTSYDLNTPDIQFSNACVTNNRVLMTVAHQRKTSSHMGVHRYGLGLISSCLQNQNGQLKMVWEGLWTGPRVAASAVINLSNNKKTVVASHDTDGQNRLYYIDETSAFGEDFTKGEIRKVQSRFTIGGVFFDENNNSGVIEHKLQRIEGFLIGSNSTEIEATYTTNGDKEEYNIGIQLTENKGCGLGSMRMLSNDVCNEKSDTKSKASSLGVYFDVNFYIEGQAKFAKIAIGGLPTDQGDFSSDIKCGGLKKTGIDPFTSCNDTQCDRQSNNFTYLF